LLLRDAATNQGPGNRNAYEDSLHWGSNDDIPNETRRQFLFQLSSASKPSETSYTSPRSETQKGAGKAFPVRRRGRSLRRRVAPLRTESARGTRRASAGNRSSRSGTAHRSRPVTNRGDGSLGKRFSIRCRD